MKYLHRALTILAALALLLAWATPATADNDTGPHHAAGTWQLRDATAQGWQDPALSTVDCTGTGTVTLTKPAGDIGTSYENTDLNLPVQAGDQLAADYTLDATGQAVAGAVRMFAYGQPDADTWAVAPTIGPYIVDETALTGTAALTIGSAGTVGTFGLTYDASNSTTGSVTWTGLRLIRGDTATPIALCPAPEPEPTVEPTVDPTTEPTVDPTTSPSATASVSPTTTTTSAPTLPVTGPSTPGLALAAVTLVVIGAALLYLTRRREQLDG